MCRFGDRADLEARCFDVAMADKLFLADARDVGTGNLGHTSRADSHFFIFIIFPVRNHIDSKYQYTASLNMVLLSLIYGSWSRHPPVSSPDNGRRCDVTMYARFECWERGLVRVKVLEIRLLNMMLTLNDALDVFMEMEASDRLITALISKAAWIDCG